MKLFWILCVGSLLEVEGSRRQADQVLTSKERKSLVGHLQSLKSENIVLVLTERQKLALRQEREFQRQGFSPFSPRSDPGAQTEGFPGNTQNPRILESPRQTEEKSLVRERVPVTFPENGYHPNVLLNRLTFKQKLAFQDKFNSLSESQQQFVFDKLLSSAPHVQAFAIKQILSLKGPLLAASIQEEMTSENPSLEPRPQPLFSYEIPTTQKITLPVPRNPLIKIQTPDVRGGIRSNEKLSEEIRAYHQEAEIANDLALRKQIETLKKLVADQANNIKNG